MIHILDKVNSTNLWAFDNLTRVNDSVLSFEQFEGRGRGNRFWISPFGGLYFSFLSKRHQLLPFISSVSIIQALPDLGSQLRLKWPNDIILDGKKLGGVLCQDDGKVAIIGMGLNFENTPPLSNSISLSDRNITVDKTLFLKDFLSFFEANFAISNKDIISEYNVYDCLLSNQISWDTGSGIAKSINPDGSLHVVTKDGTLNLYSEDVHLDRGVENA